MKPLKQLIARYRADYDFKTIASALLSLAATAFFALYNGFLGIRHASVWHGAICVYYLVLVLLRGAILLGERRAARDSSPERKKDRACLGAASLLLLLNASLVVPVSLMVIRRKPLSLSLIPAIAMAAYTTYKLTMASIHLRRRRRSADRLVHLLRTIHFIDALVSILTLQNTLIMVNASDADDSMLTLTAVTSAAVMLAVLALSVGEIVRAVRRVRRDPSGAGGTDGAAKPKNGQ